MKNVLVQEIVALQATWAILDRYRLINISESHSILYLRLFGQNKKMDGWFFTLLFP